MKYNFISADDYVLYPQYGVVHPLYARLIKGKEITDAQLNDFYEDEKIYNTNPFEYKNMDELVQILKMAIMSEEKIMVYGNFDADGICATSIIISSLKKVDARVSYYIPSRFSDGFGLNAGVLKAIRDKGFKVLITVDNGMENRELIQIARGYGIKVIIIDRHNILGPTPLANAILNPKYCEMKETNASTSYLAFRLSQALVGDSSRFYLSLACIGTIAANRSYAGNNYKVIKLGLKYMNHFKFKQIELLGDFPYCYSINTIKEIIIPKLEAISRADKNVDMSLPIKAFLIEETLSLEKCIKSLNEYSKKETKVKNKLVDEICEDFVFDNQKSIFIYDDRLKESEGVPLVDKLYFMYNVPTFVFVEDYRDRSLKKCLAKSHSSFPLNLIYSKHKDKFETFFGHATHATFTVKKNSLKDFVEMVKEETLKANVIPKEKIIDVFDVNETEITLDAVKELLFSGFSIYTNDMCFRLKNISKEKFRRSANGFHIFGNLNDDITLVGYKLAADFEKIAKDNIDIIFRPEIDEFNKDVKVTLRIYFIE